MFALLYTVLHLDMLGPVQSSTDDWHGSDGFWHDWAMGVDATCVCIVLLWEHRQASELLISYENRLREDLRNMTPVCTPVHDRLKLRCICKGTGANHQPSISKCGELAQRIWPDRLFKALQQARESERSLGGEGNFEESGADASLTHNSA